MFERNFTIFDPFTFEHARALDGKHARVKVMDSGLTATYEGVVRFVSAEETQVGNEVLMNDCIVSVRGGVQA
jgi:D-aminopeptidase